MKKKITYEDVMKIDPCYDPKEIGASEDESMTIPEFIRKYRDKVKDKEDMIWVVCRSDYMTDKDMRLFAIWCAREALKLIDTPDPRSTEACNVAERFAKGDATEDELAAARAAAWDAAWAAARAAAWDAAWAAARDARAAAWDAARAAAWAAAWDAAWAARDARAAARDAQIDQLLTYFE